MSKIIDFFAFIFKGLLKGLAFIVSAPGILLTSISTLATSVVAVVSQITSSTSTLSTIVSSSQTPLNDYISGFQSIEIPPAMSWLMYILSLDQLLNSFLALVEVIVPIALTLATFFFVTLPLFIVSFYALKFTIFLATCLFPKNYIPWMFAGLGGRIAKIEEDPPQVQNIMGGSIVFDG